MRHLSRHKIRKYFLKKMLRAAPDKIAAQRIFYPPKKVSAFSRIARIQ